MATLYSAKITNDNASPPVRASFNTTGSALRIASAIYTVTGSEVTGDVIQMVKVPKGAVIQQDLSTILWGTLATTTFTFEVGDGVDPDRYMTTLIGSTASAARTSFEDVLGAGINHVDYEYLTEDTVDITCTTILTPLAAAIIYMKVVYTMNG